MKLTLSKAIILALFIVGGIKAFASDQFIDGKNILITDIMQFFGMTRTPSKAPTGKARLYYNSTSSKLMLSSNGGNYSEIGSGGSGTPGGNTTEIQYNNAGSFAGSPSLTYSSNKLSNTNGNTYATAISGTAYIGVAGISSVDYGSGVSGTSSAATAGNGVYGTSSAGNGVLGTSTKDYGSGVYGMGLGNYSYGISGYINCTQGSAISANAGLAGSNYAINGVAQGNSSYAGSFTAQGDSSYGIYSTADGTSSYGVFGRATKSSSVAVYADNTNSTGFGVYSNQGINYFKGNTGLDIATPEIQLDVKNLVGFTAEGGLAIRVYNNTGSTISRGYIVTVAGTSAKYVILSPANSDTPLGVAYQDIPTGSWGWVVTAGYCYVKFQDSVTATGFGDTYFVYVGSTAGKADQTTIVTLTRHNAEIGHAVESVTNGGLILCDLHWN